MANTQLTCECGSTFFTRAHAEQFAQGGYGSAEFRTTSNAPKSVLICLCGKPFTPRPTQYARNTVAAIAEDDFRNSVTASQKYRKEHSLENVAQIAASPKELQDLQTEVRDLRRAVEILENPPKTAPQPTTPVPAPEAPKPTAAAAKKAAAAAKTETPKESPSEGSST